MSAASATFDTVIERDQASWLLNTKNAIDYLDYAVEHKIPREQLHSENFMQRILRRCFQSTKFFASVFMSGTADQPMTHQHDGYWQILDDESIPKAAICCWRGFGKTVGIVAKSVKSILFQLDKFILVVSKTHDEASRITENIKLELFCNRKIRAVFGTFKQRKLAEMEDADAIDIDLMFSRRGWFACDPQTGEAVCFVMPKGVGQPVRGIQVRIGDKIWRVTTGYVDDLEDVEDLQNEDLREKNKKWFFDDLLPVTSSAKPVAAGVNKGRWNVAALKAGEWRPWRWIFTDTMKHEDCIMAMLLSNDAPEWRGKVYPQCELRKDADGKLRYYSLVPEWFSHQQIREEVRSRKMKGNMSGFCREFMCIPVNPADAMWQKDGFDRYSDELEGISRKMSWHRFVICDPGRTTNEDSCPTGMLALAVDPHEHQVRVRDEVNDKIEIDDVPRQAVDLCIRTRSETLLVEVDGGDDWIRRAFEDEVRRRGQNIHLLWIEAKKKTPDGEFGKGKDARKRRDAQGTLRLYRAKQIKHENKIKGGPLEQQQLSFPFPKRWDSLDCLGHFHRALDLMQIYFEHREPAKDDRSDEDNVMNLEIEKLRRAYNDGRVKQYSDVGEYNQMLGNVA